MPSPKPLEGPVPSLASASHPASAPSCSLPPPPPPPSPSAFTNLTQNLAPATLALHADDHFHHSTSSSDVAPPIHVSTNFNVPADPEELIPARRLIVSDCHLSKYIFRLRRFAKFAQILPNHRSLSLSFPYPSNNTVSGRTLVLTRPFPSPPLRSQPQSQ